MLDSCEVSRQSAYVFADESATKALSIWTLEDQRKRMRQALKLPTDAVIHSFRHTFGTRLGETGANALTIMKVMGHSTALVSQKYVHPTPETTERAFERLDAANQKALAILPGEKRQLPATISATVEDRKSNKAKEVL